MQYILQITIYSALFYAVYLLFLKNRASHQWNRLYLLLCAALPAVIPFINVPAFYNAVPAGGVKTINAIMPAITVFGQKRSVAALPYQWGNVLVIGYLMVSMVILMNIIYQFLLFIRFVNQHKYELINGVKVLRDTNAGPGSFLNYMFLPGKEINPVIFGHELAHIQLKHSRDILFIRLLQCLVWPNIVLYFILRELKVVHEFQADACAVRHERLYVNALLDHIFVTRQFSLSNAFFHQPLKRRIMMLQKAPLSGVKLRLVKYKTLFVVIMLLVGIVYLQSCKHADVTPPQNKSMSYYPHRVDTVKGSFDRDDKGNVTNIEISRISEGTDTAFCSIGNIKQLIDNPDTRNLDFMLTKHISFTMTYPTAWSQNVTEIRQTGTDTIFTKY